MEESPLDERWVARTAGVMETKWAGLREGGMDATTADAKVDALVGARGVGSGEKSAGASVGASAGGWEHERDANSVDATADGSAALKDS